MKLAQKILTRMLAIISAFVFTSLIVIFGVAVPSLLGAWLEPYLGLWFLAVLVVYYGALIATVL